MNRTGGLLLTILLLAACSDGGGEGAGIYGVSGCATEQKNEFLHRAMLDRYYWYDRVPSTIDYASFDSPEQTLDYLRFGVLDRFSYIASATAFDNLINHGTYIGYGFSFVLDSNDRVWIRFVYTQSVAANRGMVRGDEILSINGQTVAAVIAADAWDSIFGVAQIGLPLSIQLRRKSNAIDTLMMNKATVIINSVLHSDTWASGANVIGYLVFNSFLNTSVAEFTPVFAQFKAAGVNQLILDLRYNGGGSVAVGRELVSYIKSTNVLNTDLYVALRYNDKYQANNYNFFFQPRAGSLGLSEITVISSASTCSASEQLISGLKPYLDRVTTIGSTSCGKPVGMNPQNFCDLTLLAVNFASFNASQQGDYFSGIPADCAATDDVGFDLGDANEPMLKAAQYYIDNQSCLSAGRGSGQKSDNPQGLEAIIGAV